MNALQTEELARISVTCAWMQGTLIVMANAKGYDPVPALMIAEGIGPVPALMIAEGSGPVPALKERLRPVPFLQLPAFLDPESEVHYTHLTHLATSSLLSLSKQCAACHIIE